jgi:hypothetical protein
VYKFIFTKRKTEREHGCASASPADLPSARGLWGTTGITHIIIIISAPACAEIPDCAGRPAGWAPAPCNVQDDVRRRRGRTLLSRRREDWPANNNTGARIRASGAGLGGGRHLWRHEAWVRSTAEARLILWPTET